MSGPSALVTGGSRGIGFGIAEMLVARGVVATAISPAYVATDLSDWTTDTIPADTMLTVTDVVRVVDLTLDLSPNACVPHVVMNRLGASPYEA